MLKQTLTQRQSLPLAAKIQMTKNRIRQWFDFYDGDVYLSFSGGKDSQVLASIIRSMSKPYCDIKLVFVNTGLEYPEVLANVRQLLKSGWNIEQIKPKRTYKDIWENEGIPLVSKRVARQIRIARGELGGEQSRNLVLNGLNKHGVKTKSQWHMAKKWRYLIDTEIKISDVCCDYLKKMPFIDYEKATGFKVMTAMMSSEGGTRSMIPKCNMFEGSRPKSAPMLFWLDADVWEYVTLNNIRLAEIYYDREYDFKGQKIIIQGEPRTGCMFCCFGQHLEQRTKKTRFQKMEVTHPRQHNLILNRLNLSVALDLVNVKYIYFDE